jgi:hypothetical protein
MKHGLINSGLRVNDLTNNLSESQKKGFVESGQRLVNIAGREWNQYDLLSAAERAELRNTGWPIGLVLQKKENAPIPTPNGIEARIGRRNNGQFEDFWSFRKDGNYYISRLFEEDSREPAFTSSEGHPTRAIWFDIRIWRIAEILLHSAALYRELNIPPNEPYVVSINHHGIEGREFYVSTMKRFVNRGDICHSPSSNWAKEVSQDYVTSNLKNLVIEIANGLFVLFAFTQVKPEIIGNIVDEFLHSRL